MQKQFVLTSLGKDWHPAGGGLRSWGAFPHHGLPFHPPHGRWACEVACRDGAEPHSGCHAHVHPGTRQRDRVTGWQGVGVTENAEIGPRNQPCSVILFLNPYIHWVTQPCVEECPISYACFCQIPQNTLQGETLLAVEVKGGCWGATFYYEKFYFFSFSSTSLPETVST